MTSGVISNIQRFTMHDGPGLRSTVFFKGCPLRCAWCHNPETWSFGCELRYNAAKCIGCGECISACKFNALSACNYNALSACDADVQPALANALPDDAPPALAGAGMSYDRAKCVSCHSCANACPGGAIAVSGRRVSVGDVLADVLEDESLYRRAGGGVTLSGGEPTAQPEFCGELLDALSERGVHTCLDTCGHCETGTFLRLAGKAGMVLFDFKHADPGAHERLTGVSNEVILRNLKALDASGAEIEVRVPVVPGLNDGGGNLESVAQALRPLGGVRSIVLLGYHTLGQSKIYDFDRHGCDIGADTPKRSALEQMAGRMGAASGKPVTYR